VLSAPSPYRVTPATALLIQRHDGHEIRHQHTRATEFLAAEDNIISRIGEFHFDLIGAWNWMSTGLYQNRYPRGINKSTSSKNPPDATRQEHVRPGI